MENRRRLEARFGCDRWTEQEPLAVEGATLREGLDAPFELTVDLVTRAPEADAAALLGGSCALSFQRRGVQARVCGVVTSVREGTDPEHQTHARLVVEPALAALRHRTDSRIFQNQTVPQILERVLGSGLGAFGRSFELRLDGDYPPREYTVQYRETDFDFAHRLMEEEGIAYTFEHEGEVEVMVLFDRPAHFLPLEGENGATLRYQERRDEVLEHAEGASRFEQLTRIGPNRFVTRHFDWTHPSVPLTGTAEIEDAAWPALESYEHEAPLTFHSYDHTYGGHNSNEQLRLHAERARRDVRSCDGTASCLGLRPGRRFTLLGHPRADLDQDWSVSRSETRYLAHAGEASNLQTRFECSPADVPWRPALVRDRPRIMGVQTATVVGPTGEEIHTDPHGRVKVQFHWDREGRRDDHSSCWIRVMQTMGGPGWGFSFIPRIGMEVVVTFVEGDPDRPLVTGVVYNAENPPPYDYPAEKTRLTLKTSSTPGGAGFNELRFEDRAGSEEIWLHGEKDWNTLIKNDLSRVVGRHEVQEVAKNRSRVVGEDEQVEIGRSRSKKVTVDETEEVGNNRTRVVNNQESVTIGTVRSKVVGTDEVVQIGANASQTIGANLVQSVGQNLTQTITQNVVQNVGLNETVNVAASSAKNVVIDKIENVGANVQNRVGKSVTEKIGEDVSRRVGKSVSEDIGQDLTRQITGNQTATIGQNRTIVVTMNSTESVGLNKTLYTGGNESAEVIGASSLKAKERAVEAAESVTFKVGDTEIVVTPDEVTITSKTITVAAEDKLALHGDAGVEIASGGGDVVVKGNTIHLN